MRLPISQQLTPRALAMAAEGPGTPVMQEQLAAILQGLSSTLDAKIAELQAARAAADRAARISLARQREGQIDFLTVLDAQRTLAAAEADLALADRSVAFAQVDLFRALGGGWQPQTVG